MKLILFDIDGTLLSTDGAARRAFHSTLLEVYGTAGPIETHGFAGKTDPQIAVELLTLAGLAPLAIEAGLDRLWQGYLDRLEVELRGNGHRTRVMPGVVALLDCLASMPDAVTLALLTGNIEPGAALKLDSGGLAGRFGFGAFGSDDASRDRLPAIALERAHEHTGRRFRGDDVIILGDTPFDISCGRAIGCRAAAVATGPFAGAALASAGADVVWETLEETDAIVDWLLD
ncbi:MAG TPA: HAD hydrolase-like protein [Longimicrobiales bacterium]|nr:HAD hydrolase-like protein [Longimicrobiales bacterium]